MVLTACFAVPLIIDRIFRKKRPALNWTPRRAIVTGREAFDTDPDPESEMPRYELVTVDVEQGGATTSTTIADIVADESSTGSPSGRSGASTPSRTPPR